MNLVPMTSAAGLKIINRILAFIFTAFFGAFLSYFFTLWIDYSINKTNNNLEGRWYSASCDKNSIINGEYVFDIIQINVGYFSGIELRNTYQTKYLYEGDGKILDARYFYGKWKSTKENATAGGSFGFTISAQGDSMAGTFTGNDDGGNYTRCWLLGRSPKALENAYRFYRQQDALPNSEKFQLPDFIQVQSDSLNH